jgi:protein-S-isoprenylcysteine O-methyltransferase Ste14
LPWILLAADFSVPPGAILLRAGEISAEWPVVRSLGLALSMYAGVVMTWAAATMGRFLVPQSIVTADHVLIDRGPFRYVRHPTYSGDLALWLGAALGTLNASLLLLWPFVAAGVSKLARIEEGLLESKFGGDYRAYVRGVGRFIPRVHPHPRVPSGSP